MTPLDDSLLGASTPIPAPPPDVPPPVIPPPTITPVTSGPNMVLIGVLFVAALLLEGLGIVWFTRQPSSPSPGDIDASFVSIGRTYRTPLAEAYGKAWDDGAKLLDAGQTPEAALNAVATSFQSNRLAAFQAAIKAPLNSVIPDGTDPAKITDAQRAAYAKAFRGLRKGLSGK